MSTEARSDIEIGRRYHIMSGADALGWVVAFALVLFMISTDSSPRIDCAIGVDAACAKLATKYR